MAAATLTFNVTEFRVDFPEFADPILYPDAKLQRYWDQATCFVSDQNSGYLTDACRQNAINLMTAHLLKIAKGIALNQTAKQVQGATIDKVTVTLTPPPIPNQWQWWLGTTVYGQELLALLQAKSVGGFYVGRWPELSSFRRSYGVF